MHSSPLTALCPAAAVSETWTPPSPRPYLRPKGHAGSGGERRLALSLTLPGDIRSARIARAAAVAALETRGLNPYVWPVTHAVTELVAVAAGMSPGRELYVSLRHRDDAVRLLVWDQHRHHAAPDLAAVCETRRRRALWLLAAITDDWGGKWGMGEAPQPQWGTKSWVTLPR
ncbi:MULTISPECIES: ATP-binding protein [unclassified Streptomyces]|uniref:ATP-binding protein n=1 Tax=unclassified Streptomyces TaxID=2593676 RepID=UPI002E165BB3|nr:MULTISPECIES: ATP-binding protein [unclassified Streptomyces]WSJ24920.1 ATP-binding protein [Streptomyces sp. NBC_01324]